MKRSELLEELARLNDELTNRGGAPSYNVGAVEELFDDAELAQAVQQTQREVLALKEWG